MSRQFTQRHLRTAVAAVRPSRSCMMEPLEGRQLFSFVPIGGAIDNSFHQTGTSLAVFPGDGPATAAAVAVGPGATSIVAGTVSPANDSQLYGFAFARFTSTGSLDQSFGSGGEVVIHTPGYCKLNDIAVQPDGSIIAVGTEEDEVMIIGRSRSVVFRLNANGQVDTDFGKFSGGVNGFVFEDFDPAGTPTERDTAFDKVTLINGQSIAAVANIDGHAYVREYSSQGTADLQFGTGGVFVLDMGPYDYVRDITADSAGRIYLAGQTDSKRLGGAWETNALVARLTPGGQPDVTYESGSGGAYVYGYNDGMTEFATGIAIRPDGTVLASSVEAAVGYVRIAGYGAPAAGELLTQAFLPFSTALGVAAQKTNQFIVLDSTGTLRQYNPAGGQTLNFSLNNGKSVGDPDAAPVGFAVDQNDNVLAAGTRNGVFYIKRYFGHDAPVVPAAPTQLAVVAVGQGSVSLHWFGNSNSEDAYKTTYAVQRSATGIFAGTGTVLPPGTENYTFTGLPAGKTYYYRVRAVNAIGFSLGSNVVNATAAASSPFVRRINAGGPAFTDSAGHVFAAESGFTGGSTITDNYNVLGTDDDHLYLTRHVGASFSFATAVANGHYQVKLYFADPTFNGVAGQRKFDVLAEGTKALSNFDIIAAGGAHKAVVKTIDVVVSDKVLNLSFLGKIGSATVSAIELTQV